MDGMGGFATALGEITLVLFTTLAPSGAIALALMGLPIVAGRASEDERRRIDKFVSVPLVVSMVGLVASATHLGNPANALYVFVGVGRSPLSTEVFCAVVFQALAGVYWLYSFAERPRRGLQRGWMGALIVASGAFVTSVAFAYAADTIVSWDTWHVPANLWLNALVGGPLLALLGLRLARFAPADSLFGRVLVGMAVVALALNVGGYVLQGADLPGLRNAFVSAAGLVPSFGVLVAVFGVCGVLGIGLDGWALFVKRRPLSVVRASVACVLAFAGIFAMRFAFYMMHLTVGLGV